MPEFKSIHPSTIWDLSNLHFIKTFWYNFCKYYLRYISILCTISCTWYLTKFYHFLIRNHIFLFSSLHLININHFWFAIAIIFTCFKKILFTILVVTMARQYLDHFIVFHVYFHFTLPRKHSTVPHYNIKLHNIIYKNIPEKLSFTKTEKKK